MWAYFIMPTYILVTGGPMGMFKNSTKETKEFEKVILEIEKERDTISWACLLYTSPSPRDGLLSRMPSSA